jgi:hypothetical protein
MAYPYPPPQNANSIRLLHLGSGCCSTPLKAHLASYRLGDHCSYDALSYAWGEPDLTELLLVDDQEFKVSKNLHTILLHLRYPDRIRTLWIDAICINQQDGIEKGQQITLMGQIYQQADTVLCWLGELSTHRLWALEFLQMLAKEAPRYKNPDDVEYCWTFLNDELVPGVDVNLVVEAALEAHVEAVYKSDWFTRLWVVQELALARNPRILCGAYDLGWEEFELATRVIVGCLGEISRLPKTLRSMADAWDIISLRGRYSLNMRPVTARPVIFHIDQPWSIGRLAWDMRNKKCKDDRDRVYALLGLTASGNGFKVFVPDTFIPDYTRPVEWVYYQFWRRFGGYTSLFHAGLSRRRGYSKTNGNEAVNEDVLVCFNDNYLPSWVPDLRPHHTKEWKPIFGSDYATSTPMHHMGAKFTKAPGVLMIRGHRFDVVVRGFHISQQIEPCRKFVDFVNLRTTINFFLSLESEYEPYPNGQAWIEALGSTLMTDMPYEHDHPFQRYLDTFQLNTRLSDNELRRIWKLYLDLLLADTGGVWTKFCSIALSRKVLHFDPFVELTHDGQLAWMLHKYLGDVLQAHRLIITERGHMGLAPPDTAVGDVVVAFGGPGVPFVVRDVSALVFGGLVADEANGIMVPDEIGRNLSQLLGPCYLQGIMRAELLVEERYKTDFEWETDWLGTIPKPTLCLI